MNFHSLSKRFMIFAALERDFKNLEGEEIASWPTYIFSFQKSFLWLRRGWCLWLCVRVNQVYFSNVIIYSCQMQKLNFSYFSSSKKPAWRGLPMTQFHTFYTPYDTRFHSYQVCRKLCEDANQVLTLVLNRPASLIQDRSPCRSWSGALVSHLINPEHLNVSLQCVNLSLRVWNRNSMCVNTDGQVCLRIVQILQACCISLVWAAWLYSVSNGGRRSPRLCSSNRANWPVSLKHRLIKTCCATC